VLYVVFAQRTEPSVDLVGILQNARRWFDASIDVVDERRSPEPPATPESTVVRIRLDRPKQNLSASFEVRSRRVTPDDLARARDAETRGRAAGMADLAARCPTLWEITSSDGGEIAVLTIAAIFAATALGPVMPPDGSTLFGVRGAMERVEKLQNA